MSNAQGQGIKLFVAMPIPIKIFYESKQTRFQVSMPSALSIVISHVLWISYASDV